MHGMFNHFLKSEKRKQNIFFLNKHDQNNIELLNCMSKIFEKEIIKQKACFSNNFF